MGPIHWILLCISLKLTILVAQTNSQGCTQRVTASSEENYLRTPNYPNFQDPGSGGRITSSICRWTITAREGERVRVTMKYGLISTPDGCLVANTKLYDRDGPNSEDRLIATWCGESPSTFTSWGNYMKIRAQIYKLPMEVKYSAEPYEPCYTKLRVTDKQRHNITSRGYPDKYGANTECRWELDISARYKRNETIRLFFMNVDLGNVSCTSEYMRLYSQSTPAESAELAVICGQERMTLEFYIETILIVFKSGWDYKGMGFNIFYNMLEGSSCDKVLEATARSQTLTTDDYPAPYRSFQRCTYKIIPRMRDMNVKLEVLFSDINYYCHKEYVLVYDGLSEDRPLLGKWCGNARPKYKSLRGGLYLVFISEDNSGLEAKGFRAVYKEEMCGGAIDVSEQARLTFPDSSAVPFTDRIRCEWTLNTAYERIIIYFISAYINCPSSEMKIKDGSGETWTVCNYPNGMYLSSGRRMVLTLTSDGTSPFLSFILRLWSEKDLQACDEGSKGYLAAKAWKQKLLSPGYPSRYPDRISCVWQIQAETPLENVKITVSSMDLEPSGCNDYVAFFHGPVSVYTNPDVTLCGSESREFYSEGKYATVHFYSDNMQGRKGFVLYYESISSANVRQPVVTTSSFPLTLVIAGVGGAVLIIIIMIIICICVRRRQFSQPPSQPAQSTHPNSDTRDATAPFLVTNPRAASSASPPPPPPNTSAPPPTYNELHPGPASIEPSAPPLPPPSYEDAVSKGMIQDMSETGF